MICHDIISHFICKMYKMNEKKQKNNSNYQQIIIECVLLDTSNKIKLLGDETLLKTTVPNSNHNMLFAVRFFLLSYLYNTFIYSFVVYCRILLLPPSS